MFRPDLKPEKSKSKTCLCGCGRVKYSHGYSKSCQYKRNDSKWAESLAKTKQPKQSIKNNEYVPTGEGKIFQEIWSERKHVSFISGLPIVKMTPDNFLHILPKGKGKYYKYKLYKQNIILGTSDEHDLVDAGTVDKREAYAKEMKEKHNVIVDW